MRLVLWLRQRRLSATPVLPVLAPVVLLPLPLLVCVKARLALALVAPVALLPVVAAVFSWWPAPA